MVSWTGCSPATPGTSNRVPGWKSTTIVNVRAFASKATSLHDQGFWTDVIERQPAHQERNVAKDAYNQATTSTVSGREAGWFLSGTR